MTHAQHYDLRNYSHQMEKQIRCAIPTATLFYSFVAFVVAIRPIQQFCWFLFYFLWFFSFALFGRSLISPALRQPFYSALFRVKSTRKEIYASPK